MILYLILTILIAQSNSLIAPKSQLNSDTSPFKNGTTYIFTSLMDKSVITVHKDGEVTTEEYTGSPEQKWTLVTHPLDPEVFEFKQAIVPYNTLSGYQNPPDNPGIFPRPLGLSNRGKVKEITAWNILIRNRWCIQANGYGQPMDIDDCEYFVAPWQLWQLDEVSLES